MSPRMDTLFDVFPGIPGSPKATITALDEERQIGEMMIVDTVYLLHFDSPYPNGKRPQHYLGHADKGRFARRITEHRNGSSKARLTQVFAELGIQFVIARTWTGDYDLERSLKRRHRPASLCPICRGEA